MVVNRDSRVDNRDSSLKEILLTESKVINFPEMVNFKLKFKKHEVFDIDSHPF